MLKNELKEVQLPTFICSKKMPEITKLTEEIKLRFIHVHIIDLPAGIQSQINNGAVLNLVYGVTSVLPCGFVIMRLAALECLIFSHAVLHFFEEISKTACKE